MPAPPAPSSSPSSPDASPSSLPATQPPPPRRTRYRPTLFPYIDSSKLSDPALNAVAGATAGFVSGVFVCPLDVIKTKLQAQGGFLRQRHDPAQIPGQPLRYRGLTGTFKMILQEEGIRGMYRGLAPLVLGYLPTWMVYFTVYGRAKVYMEGVIEHKPLNHLACSVIAGASSTLCTNPIWVIKTRLMSQASLHRSLASLRTSPYHYQNTLDAARKMYAHEGLRSFYSGLGPALLGLTHVAVQFPLYEFLKGTFTGGVGLGQTREGGGTDYVGVLAASALSKMAASSATYPHEVLRTRLQTQRVLLGHVVEQVGMEGQQGGGRADLYRGIVRSVRTIWREEGWRAFYAGMGTNLVRAVPASAVTMLTFEAIMSRLLRIREEGRLARCPVA